MASFRIYREDILPLLTGLVVMGTGGGGSPARGDRLMNNDLDRGRALEIVDIDSVDDDSFICSGGNMGSVKATSRIDYDKQVIEWEKDFPLLRSFALREEYCHRKIDYLIPFELGGGNTPIILSVAARKGIPVIDGDLVGRAAPETQMAAPIGHGVSLYPMTLVDDRGNEFIVANSADPTYADRIGRILIQQAGNCGGNTHYSMSGREAKGCVIPGTISQALKLGRELLLAKEQGRDGLGVAQDLLAATRLFIGAVTSMKEEDKGGFFFNSVTLDGMDCFKNSQAVLTIKNEVMMIEIDGQTKLMFPDYGYIVSPETGFGIQSANIKEGMEIAVLAKPCHPHLQECLMDPIGKKAFGPERYGFPEKEYIPFAVG